MQTIKQTFTDFLASLELTEHERGEAIRQHTYMREQLQGKLDVGKPLLSGSYARKTAIRPLNDIDIFLVLREGQVLHPSLQPQALLDKVKGTVEQIYPGKSVKRQARSVNIEFSGTGIAYDVVPAFVFADEVYLIPDGDARRWIKSNPQVHAQQSTAANERAAKMLKPLIKAIKHSNYLYGKPARSFHLEVLSWSILRDHPGSYLDGLCTLLAGLASRVCDRCPDPAGLGPEIQPSAQKCSAARRWLENMANLARRARDLEGRGEALQAHNALRELFGSQWPEGSLSISGPPYL